MGHLKSNIKNIKVIKILSKQNCEKIKYLESFKDNL